jgi:hypothetical protein
MLVLTRKANEVYHDDVKLTIVEQATKGPGKEVVKIDGLDGSNGQKWISLSKLVEGKNEVSCKGREVTSTGSYTLTPAEKLEVDALQLQIDAIKDAAKARYVPKSVDPSKMSADELEAYITKLRNSLKG